MDFDHTSERRLLVQTLQRYLRENYSVETRNRIAYDPPYHLPQRWQELCELGIAAALVPGSAGGLGGTGFEIALVFEELGRTLCPEPFLATLLSARVLLHADAEGKSAHWAGLAEGSQKISPAFAGAGDPYDSDAVPYVAAPVQGGFVLSGRKSVLYGGHLADRFLVSALNRESNRTGLFEVQAKDAEVRAYGLIDGGGAADLFLDATPAGLVMADAKEAVEDALDYGRVALCAEAVGVMDELTGRLQDYLQTRKQFGRALSDFQALQHRLVDLLIELEQARSIVISAAEALGTPGQARKTAMAKNLIGRAGKLIAEEAVQMHGGIAMTWEFPVSHYAKRLTMIDHQLGDADTHLTRLAGLY